MSLYSHHSKTGPLNPNLRNPKSTGKTPQGTDLTTTCKVCTTGGQGEDVGKGEGAGCRSQEDKVGRDALGGPTRNDAVVLWEVREQYTEENESGKSVIGSCRWWSLEVAHSDRAKFHALGDPKASQ